MRLIDADALRARFQAILDRGDMFCEYDIIGMVDNAPTVFDEKAYSDGYTQGTCDCEHAHERPQGEWIKHIDNLFPEESTEECPFCHEEQRLVGNDDNFCPNCGADMRKEAENDTP